MCLSKQGETNSPRKSYRCRSYNALKDRDVNLLITWDYQGEGETLKNCKRSNALALALVTACIVSPMSAGGTYMVMGAGYASCGAYLADRRTNSDALNNMVQQWMFGYITAIHKFSDRMPPPLRRLGDTDGDAILYYLDNYCKEHPLDKVINAADAMVLELGTKP